MPEPASCRRHLPFIPSGLEAHEGSTSEEGSQTTDGDTCVRVWGEKMPFSIWGSVRWTVLL